MIKTTLLKKTNYYELRCQREREHIIKLSIEAVMNHETYFVDTTVFENKYKLSIFKVNEQIH